MNDEDKPGEHRGDMSTTSLGGDRSAEEPEEEAKPGEEARLHLEARYRSVLNLSRDGIATLSSDGTMVEANRAFVDLLGIRADEIAGMNLGRFCVNRPDWDVIRKMVESEGVVRNFQWKALTRGEVERECLLTASKVPGPDTGELWYQVIVSDETDRRKSLQMMLQADRLQALGEMAGSVAHNLRNLLQIIVSGTRLALANLESGHPGEVKAQLEQVVGSLRSAGETARLLNHFASIRGDKPLRRGRIFDLNEVVGKAVDVRQAWLEANPVRTKDKITISTSLKPGCMVRGVENDLLEVVVNLLWNAVDAMPRGGEIALRTWAEAGRVFLEVSDTGVGIKQRDLPKVFQPFWTTKGLLGTGLGLAGSYGIVSHHKGEISVKSVEGRGTTFRLELPLAERIFERAKRPKQVDVADLTCNILVVDDLEPLLRMLEGGLLKRGHRVFAASSGQEALELFRTKEIDIVLCDLAMPEMNGWDVGKAIKKICEERGTAKTPFVLVTGWGGHIDEHEELDAGGVDRVLEKPVDIGKLTEVIQELVVQRRKG